MAFTLASSFAPMEAASVSEIPRGEIWQYEPKWDGFRCLAFRSGKEVELRSKSGQLLSRYFPEIVSAIGKLKADNFVLDGEIVIPEATGLSFDALLQRIHPAESRIKKLSNETPGWLIVFDLLATKIDGDLTESPLRERRAKLEAFAKKYFKNDGALRLSPATAKISQAEKWFGAGGSTLDGLIAKNLELPYASGKRDAMVKIKPQRSADCVVGGFRYAENKKLVGSLLLGLYDEDGKLNHVGFCSGIKNSERAALTKKLEALIEAPGFTGKAPGGPSRWNSARSAEWKPLKPKLVVEVTFDHVTGDRFRHGTGLVRWRPDKAPQQCTMDQMHQKRSTSLARLLGTGK